MIPLIMSYRVRLTLLILAAVSQFASIFLDQKVIQMESEISDLQFEYSINQIVEAEFSLKSKLLSKEWQALRTNMDRMLTAQGEVKNLWEEQFQMASYLLTFTSRASKVFNDSNFKEEKELLSNASHRSIKEEKGIEERLINLDQDLVSLSQAVMDVRNSLSSKNVKIEKTLSFVEQDRQGVLLVSVISQIFGLLMLIGFFLTEYYRAIASDFKR